MNRTFIYLSHSYSASAICGLVQSRVGYSHRSPTKIKILINQMGGDIIHLNPGSRVRKNLNVGSRTEQARWTVMSVK